MIEKKYGLDAVYTYIENYSKSIYAVSIPHPIISKMTYMGAIHLMNSLPLVCDDYAYIVSYFDEDTHDCILVFKDVSKEIIIRNRSK